LLLKGIGERRLKLDGIIGGLGRQIFASAGAGAGAVFLLAWNYCDPDWASCCLCRAGACQVSTSQA